MSPTSEIRFVRLSNTAKCPTYGSDGAAGMDLYADENAVVYPGARCLITMNVAIAIPSGYEGQIRPRSGLALKHGVTVLNAPGTIDSDYRGSLAVMLFNSGTDAFDVRIGDRIGQLVIARYERVAMKEANSLPQTDRGAKGFGSTGVR